MTPKTRVVSVHYLRTMARIRERELQHLLERRAAVGVTVNGIPIPAWARGASVEKAGRFQWVVTVTSERGH